MPESIKENIITELATRVADVTTDNGYQQTLTVERPKSAQGDITPDHYKAVVVQDDPVRDRELDIPGNPNAIGWKQVFIVCVYVRPSESDTTPVERLLNRVEADVMKAIAGDGSDWHTFNNNAIEAEFYPPEQFPHESGSFDGVAIPVVVTYRTNENDPYTAR